jgi:hypothetical protein
MAEYIVQIGSCLLKYNGKQTNISCPSVDFVVAANRWYPGDKVSVTIKKPDNVQIDSESNNAEMIIKEQDGTRLHVVYESDGEVQRLEMVNDGYYEGKYVFTSTADSSLGIKFRHCSEQIKYPGVYYYTPIAELFEQYQKTHKNQELSSRLAQKHGINLKVNTANDLGTNHDDLNAKK